MPTAISFKFICFRKFYWERLCHRIMVLFYKKFMIISLISSDNRWSEGECVILIILKSCKGKCKFLIRVSFSTENSRRSKNHCHCILFTLLMHFHDRNRMQFLFIEFTRWINLKRVDRRWNLLMLLHHFPRVHNFRSERKVSNNRLYHKTLAY